MFEERATPLKAHHSVDASILEACASRLKMQTRTKIDVSGPQRSRGSGPRDNTTFRNHVSPRSRCSPSFWSFYSIGMQKVNYTPPLCSGTIELFRFTTLKNEISTL